MQTQKGNQLLDKLSARIRVKRGRVGNDISVVAYAELDNRLFKVIATHGNDLPTFEDLKRWAIHNSEGKYRVLEDTLSHYDVMPYPLVSFIVEANFIRRPFALAMEDKNLVAIADNMYMDVDLKTPWKTEEFQGSKFLVRVEEDSISDFLASQLNAPGPRTSKKVSAVLAMTANKGDKVKYIRPDSFPSTGVVTKVGYEGTVFIRDNETHNTYERPHGVITEIIQDGPATKAKDNKLENFFSEIYGPDIGKKLMS